MDIPETKNGRKCALTGQSPARRVKANRTGKDKSIEVLLMLMVDAHCDTALSVYEDDNDEDL